MTKKKVSSTKTPEQEKIDSLELRIVSLDYQVRALTPRPRKAWYKEAGTWIAILLTIGMIGLIYLLWLDQQGIHLIIPKWLRILK